MSFAYDFDFCSIPANTNSEGSRRVARFRDAALVDALDRAEPAVQWVFLHAGFDLNAGESPLAAGFYSAEDQQERTECLRRFADNLQQLGHFRDREWGGFDPVAFLTHLESALPHEQIEFSAQQAAHAHQATSRRRWRLLARLGLVLGGALVATSAVGMFL